MVNDDEGVLAQSKCDPQNASGENGAALWDAPWH